MVNLCTELTDLARKLREEAKALDTAATAILRMDTAMRMVEDAKPYRQRALDLLSVENE